MRAAHLLVAFALAACADGGAPAPASERAAPMTVAYQAEPRELMNAYEALPGNVILPPLGSVLSIINGTDAGITPGMRLRAIRALGQLSATTDATVLRGWLAQLLVQYRDDRSGTALLYLQAALEALAQLRVADDVPAVAALLSHPSRDVRITAARALRTIGDQTAVTWLRNQKANEQVPAVELEISEALQSLTPAN